MLVAVILKMMKNPLRLGWLYSPAKILQMYRPPKERPWIALPVIRVGILGDRAMMIHPRKMMKFMVALMNLLP